MTVLLAAYAAALVAFVVADMVWLGVMVPRFYRPALADLLASDVNLAAAIAFYLLYPVGLVIFAIHPALKSEVQSTAIVYGALFGFFTYATYDLTNHATLRNWSAAVTIVDIAWGTVLGAFAAAVGVFIAAKVASAG